MSKTNRLILELEAKIWCKLHDVKGESVPDCCKAYMSGADRECSDFAEFIRGIADIVMNKTNSVCKDGVYITYKDGHSALFDGNNSKNNVKYVGLKMGSKSINVALHDAADKEVTLTCEKDKGDYKKYIDSYEDAVSDWDGESNTECLKKVGFNPKIALNEGEYVPAVGQSEFIRLFRNSINEALRYVGGAE